MTAIAAESPRSVNDLTEWDHDAERYAPGWFIGSEADDGAHLRDTSGWPYSIYRRALNAPPHLGVSDMVLCTGIQNLGDAHTLAQMLNARVGIDRYR